MNSDQDDNLTEREPRGLHEHVVANCRPQPAIPALLAFFLLALLPIMLATPPAGELVVWKLWLIAAGIIISCGLAIAAGFCSVAPPVLWILCAFWALSLSERAGLPDFHTAVIYLGMAAAVAMIIIQIWRILTRRFIPTVSF